MKRIFLLFLMFFPLQIFAGGIGDVDDRYYVLDAMWAKEPYKQFVFFSSDKVGYCTGQYIAPNLILSARHCTSQDDKHYKIRTYNSGNELIPVTLITNTHETEGDPHNAWQQLGDWDVFLIEDSRYYSDSYFDIQKLDETTEAGYQDVLNAGYGYIRIIKQSEIPIIKTFIEKWMEQTDKKDIENLSEALFSKKKKITINKPETANKEAIEKAEKAFQAIEPLKESYPPKLKASKCRVVFKDCSKEGNKEICENHTSLTRHSLFPNVLGTTCDTWGGNSGGGFISTTTSGGKYLLYGINSFGSLLDEGFSDETSRSRMASSHQFKDQLLDIIEQNATANGMPCNVSPGSGSGKYNNGTCLLDKCDDSDYELNSTKTSCVLTNAAQKRIATQAKQKQKEEEQQKRQKQKEADLQAKQKQKEADLLAKQQKKEKEKQQANQKQKSEKIQKYKNIIEESIKNFSYGASISYPSDIKDDLSEYIKAWEEKCDNFGASQQGNPKSQKIEIPLTNKIRKECKISECQDNAYTTNKKQTKCISVNKNGINTPVSTNAGLTVSNITSIVSDPNGTLTSDDDDQDDELTINTIQNQRKTIDDLKVTVQQQGQQVIPTNTQLTANQVLTLVKTSAEYQMNKERLEELQKKYDDAMANEQSLANRTLTALTVAATGIGGMELARGLAEQKADKEAEADMAAYMATMRCTYGDGKQVKAGPDEIELPGGNSQELMSLRSEYFTLAADLKERKTALGMKPGIESEEILDKAATGLYDDDNVGIDSGAYASLYRAQMLGSEEDQSKIDEDKSASKKRVIGGGVASGVGVVGSIVGNQLINGEKD